jgi:hypothetical protein
MEGEAVIRIPDGFIPGSCVIAGSLQSGAARTEFEMGAVGDPGLSASSGPGAGGAAGG